MKNDEHGRGVNRGVGTKIYKLGHLNFCIYNPTHYSLIDHDHFENPRIQQKTDTRSVDNI